MRAILGDVCRAVCVVAHPDDESMWFAGLIAATFERINWTVIACSIPRRDPERVLKFYDACKVLAADARVLPFIEPDARTLNGLEWLDLSPWPMVVTHNAVGEYGNAHHVLVHETVKAKHDGRLLVTGYGTDEGAIVLDLPPQEYDEKLAAIRCYNHTTAVDKRPKCDALLARYGEQFNLKRETYHELRR